MDKRKKQRFGTKLHVKLRSGSLISWGILSDVSEDGLFVRCNQNFVLDAVIDIEIFLRHDSSLIKGVVRRIVELPEPNRKFGIGIELIEKDGTYRRLLKFLKEEIRTCTATM